MILPAITWFAPALQGAALKAPPLTDITLTAVNAIADPSPENPVGVTLVLRESGPRPSSTAYLLQDVETLRWIEESRHVILEDFLEKELTGLGITLEFTGLCTRRVTRSGEAFQRITKWIQFKPPGKETEPVDFADLHPACPPEDRTHRYIDVPVDYNRPRGESFRLYYEVNRDFDSSKPTILIPTDAQRSFSQAGWADRYKKVFSTRLNVVIFEYRGTFCSAIPGLNLRDIDWERAWQVYHSDNVVEDMERIRRHLLGDRPIHVLGGSGTAMMGLKYLSKYHQHVERAYLMSFFKDAEGSSRAGIRFFRQFLDRHDLRKAYVRAVERTGGPGQLRFLIQRLLYFRQEQARELITRTARGDLDLYRQFSRRFGSLNYFVRAARKYRPWTVVFMYETNIPTPEAGIFDINAPFFSMAQPLAELARRGRIRSGRFDITGLEKVRSEVLLIAGTKDPVAPLSEMERIHRGLPNSRLAVFNAGHCLQMDPAARQCRNDMVDLFFIHGMDSKPFQDYLAQRGKAGLFLELR